MNLLYNYDINYKNLFVCISYVLCLFVANHKASLLVPAVPANQGLFTFSRPIRERLLIGRGMNKSLGKDGVASTQDYAAVMPRIRHWNKIFWKNIYPVSWLLRHADVTNDVTRVTWRDMTGVVGLGYRTDIILIISAVRGLTCFRRLRCVFRRTSQFNMSCPVMYSF